MKTKNSTVFVLAFVISVAVSRIEGAAQQAIPIDLSPAIKIDDFTVSRYLFEKAYFQFVTPIVQRTGQKPSADEMERWFRLYLAQQLIKADLVVQKQLDRPEIVEITAQMARHMLVQPRGLLYRELGGSDPITVRRERRSLVLVESHFSERSGNIVRLWNVIARPLMQETGLSGTEVALVGSSILADYVLDGENRQISAKDWMRDFQRGIARMAPRDADELRQQVEDLAVAECDLTEAKRRRLDQTPQFLADRYNFSLNQALALYEKEILGGEIKVSPEELRAYYDANRDRYCSPAQITGVLNLFPDDEHARRSLTSTLIADEPFSMRSSELVDPFIVCRDGAPGLSRKLYSLFVSMPVGHRYGPFLYRGKYAVFLKRSAGEATPMPFDEVRPEVESLLVRQKVAIAELDRLTGNIARVKVCLDLASYGLKKSDLNALAEKPGGQDYSSTFSRPPDDGQGTSRLIPDGQRM